MVDYLIFFFFLLYLRFGCRADSSSSMHIDAHERRTKSTVNNDISIRPNELINGENDKYQYILTRLESWMKEKRKNDKRNLQDDEDIISTMARPFVTLAYAQTLDGMIAAKGTESDAITSNLLLSCPQSTILTHHLRNVHDAILIGGSTFLADQPRLNVRLPSKHTPSGGVRHPIPIILDTNLQYLQRLIFCNWKQSTTSLLQSILSNDQNLPEIMLENIRAHHPIICCSSIAAQTFLDILEILFQEDDPSQSRPKRKRKKSYKISVYKKIDVQNNNDHKTDNYMPIKITIHVTSYHNDTKQDITLTLLPCRIDNKTNSLDLKHVLSQLYNQFDIESVMVEGGASILSSFLNECVVGERTKSVEESSRTRAGGQVVDCICVTIAPKIIGGKRGLPVLGKFDMLPALGSKPENGGECGLEEEECMMLCQGAMAIKEGEFLSFGKDCTFLGRI